MSLALGIDIGGTSVRAALVHRDGQVERAARRQLGGRTPEAVIELVLALVRELSPDAAPLPVAAGTAGLLVVESGLVVNGPNHGWRDVPLGAMLSQAFGRRVRLVNDLDAIAYGEAMRGAGRGARDVVCIFVGTGVGMGAVVQGRIVEGWRGMATELGHTKVVVTPEARACGCGERGCLEAYTSGRHLPELLAAKVAEGYASTLATGSDLSRANAGAIEAAARAGDAAAQALWADVAERLGLAVANVITLFNPSVVIFGGGVLTSAPSLEAAVMARALSLASQPVVAGVVMRDTELGDDAGVIGAGLLAHESG